MHASQCRRLRLSTGSPHIAHAFGEFGRASTVGVRHARVTYGRDCEALRGVASSGERAGAETLRRLFPDLAARGRGAAPLLARASRKVCARRAAIGRRHSRQCGSVSASSCVSGAAIRQMPFGSSPKSRAVNVRSSKRSSRKRPGPRAPALSHRAQTNRGCADRHGVRRSWDRSRVRVARGALPIPRTQKDSSAQRAGIRARSRSRKRMRTSRHPRTLGGRSLALVAS
jgi:hypothetical protein